MTRELEGEATTSVGDPPDAATSRVSTTGLILGLVTFATLGLVVSFLVLSEADEQRSNAWQITYAIMLLAAARLSMLVTRGRRRLFEYIFWLFCYVFFGLAPTVQLRLDEMATTTPDLDPFLDWTTATYALLGILLVAAGFALAERTQRPARSGLARTFAVHRGRVMVLSAVGMATSLYYVAAVGPRTLFASRTAASAIEDQIWSDPSVAGIVRASSSFPILIAAHGWWALAQRSHKGWTRAVAGALTAVALLVTNPVSSSRYGSGVVWGSFLGTLGVYKTRIRTSISMVVLVVSLLFIFPVADLFRRVDAVNVARSGFLSEYAGNGDYDAFGQLSNAVLYDKTVPLAFGRQLLGQAFFYVPRSVWPSKPVDSGVLLAQFRGYQFQNLSAPIWAELLLNFGIIGLLLGSVAVGFGLGRLDAVCERASRVGVMGIAVSVLPLYLLILLRGSLLQATGTLVVILACLVFITAGRKPASAD